MQKVIEAAWDDRSLLDKEVTREAIRKVIDELDRGVLRVAEPVGDQWQVNEWVKKAVILYFPMQKWKR